MPTTKSDLSDEQVAALQRQMLMQHKLEADIYKRLVDEGVENQPEATHNLISQFAHVVDMVGDGLWEGKDDRQIIDTFFQYYLDSVKAAETDDEDDTHILELPVQLALALALLRGYRNGQITGDRMIRMIPVPKTQTRRFRYPFTIPLRPMLPPSGKERSDDA